MEQYDGGTPVDPNNPLIGKNFNIVVGGTNVNIIKNISATTMSIFDTDENEWLDDVPYTYDSTNKILTIPLGEDTINADITLLDNNIIAVVSEGLFLTSNGGTSVSLLDGYSMQLEGAVIGGLSRYNCQFDANNIASFDGTLNAFYAIADDNSSNDGTFYGYIDYLGIMEVTKVDGVYTKFNYEGLEFTLTPPQS